MVDYSNPAISRSKLYQRYLKGALSEDYLHLDIMQEGYALTDFERDSAELEEYLREDIREEEMRIAQEENYELELRVKDLEEELKDHESHVLEQLITRAKSLMYPVTASDDVEEWAYRDGWNDALDKLRGMLAD